MISKQKIIKKLATIIVFLAIISFLASKFYWYYAIWWLDIPMHFLGGVVVSFLFFYIFYSWLLNKNFSKKLFLSLIFVLIVGLGWEIFEYIFNNLIKGDLFYLKDTLEDLFFDILGSIVGFFVCYNPVVEFRKNFTTGYNKKYEKPE